MVCKGFKNNGFNVTYSHINEGKDFFEYQPEKWDVIISNSPYQNKRKFIERCLELGKLFSLLLPVGILSDAVCNETFRNDLQLLIPQQRIEFIDPNNLNRKQRVSFKVVYFGYKIFQKQLTLLEKKDMNTKDVGI